ncbi:MAG: cupin domain-containing protein [Hyphomicrobium sp.]|uniref:cupin domain-containing protein n=1 Tax=Hyphomicrobium sp. TaxID=82 RepID=UPI003D0B5646
MKNFLAAVAATALLATPALAESGLPVEDMLTFKAGEIKWSDEPLLPKGAQSSLILGDPSKPGVFVVRIKLPANYVVPPHTHPFAEMITVLSGSMGNAMGETFDPAKGDMLKAGSSFALPAEHAHYVWTEGEPTELELVATGPWGITYLNPADDPRSKK